MSAGRGLLQYVHTSPQRSAGSCLSRSGLLHGIASMKPILSAAYAGPCNGPNRRPIFANLKSTRKSGCPPFRRRPGSAGTGADAASHLGKRARAAKRFRTPVNPAPNTISCLLYVFRWNPGRNSALLANLHRPDVCLPASGWTQVADDGVRNYPVTGAFELPFRHFEFQRAIGNSAPQTAHAFYCLSEDRAAESSVPATTSLPGMTGSRSEWTRAERLRTVLEGRRHLGQQVIEAIFVSNESFSSADAESRLRDLVREVVVLR